MAAAQAAELELLSAYEDQAVRLLADAAVDFAVVTGEVVEAQHARVYPDLHALALGHIRMQLAAGTTHPLVSDTVRLETAVVVSALDLAAAEFAGSRGSAFCGIERGDRAFTPSCGGACAG